MPINQRGKGGRGEREACQLLNPIVEKVLRELGRPVPDVPIIQRNQNQSAVGGQDLVGTFGLCFEIKRQETLNLNGWWEQTCSAANRLEELPVLMFRQNGKRKWRVITWGLLFLPGGNVTRTRLEMSHDDFVEWFENWVRSQIQNGYYD